MGENVSKVTIGIMRLNGDIWLTVSVSDFRFVTSALALTLTLNILCSTCYHL